MHTMAHCRWGRQLWGMESLFPPLTGDAVLGGQPCLTLQHAGTTTEGCRQQGHPQGIVFP